MVGQASGVRVVSGPGPSPSNVDDFYGPEINSLSSNFETDNDIPVKFLNCSPSLPDQLSVANGDDYTGSFQNIQPKKISLRE